MSVRPLAAMALVAMLAPACGTPSEVAADARLQVRGSVVTQDGSPISDAPVVMVKEIGVDEFLSGATTVLTTWGFACVTEAAVDPCGEYDHRTATDGEGTFAFDLRGADVRSGFGTASTMTLTAAGPASEGQRTGPATSLSFLVQRELLDLPELRLWEPELHVSQEGGRLTVTWPTLPTDLSADASYEAVAVDEQGRPVWTLTDGSAGVDVRVLEDVRGGVAVQASAETVVDERRSDVVYRSGQLPVEGPGAPPSRGASCSATDGEHAEAFVPCPLTDGDLGTLADVDLDVDCPEGQTQCPHPPDSAIVLDLGSSGPRSLVVLRGDEDDLVIDVSDDGTTWTQVIAVEMEATQVAVPLPPGTTGRYLRVRGAVGDVGQFAEISVW